MAVVGKRSEKNFIKFLGTAGARFVMIKQLRSSGGIWISYKSTQVLIDPGPGSLVRCAMSRPKLNPCQLDALILTHKHLDHSGDINVMIEAMTEGGFKKKGTVFVAADSLYEDPVIFKYITHFPQAMKILQPRRTYQVGAFSFKTSMRHLHPVETYGVRFKMGDTSVGLLADTKYFDALLEFYRTDILIIGVVFLKPHPAIDHLSMDDVEKIIRELKPKKAILTHFGMSMLKAKPHLLCQALSKKTGIDVQAAYDGMTVTFN